MRLNKPYIHATKGVEEVSQKKHLNHIQMLAKKYLWKKEKYSIVKHIG